MNTPEFKEFPKIARLSREIVITEKLDGTNGCVHIYKEVDGAGYECERYSIIAGSRSRWISPEDDNYGFAKWVRANQEELIAGLGEGTHFGEWWGSGIQRGYGLTGGDKRFSLFNTHRWSDMAGARPQCCGVVPVLWNGIFDGDQIDNAITSLRMVGSFAAPGFMKPEGIVIYHSGNNALFKKTIEKDEEWKGKST